MGLEKHRVVQQFGLREIGVLDGPPLRGAEVVVNSAAELLNVPAVVVLIFDDVSSTLECRAASSLDYKTLSFPTSGSLCSSARSENATIAITNARIEAPSAPEPDKLKGQSVIACPIYGPDTEAIGVLMAVRSDPHVWSIDERKTAEDMAYLVSQEVILRASFETLRIMSSERGVLGIKS